VKKLIKTKNLQYNNIKMKVYRDVYIKSSLPKFKGSDFLYYTGKIVNNGELKLTGFDRNLDIYLGCDCDARKYKAIMKVSGKQNTTIKNNVITNGKKKCNKCWS
jgi:hypothetical protein